MNFPEIHNYSILSVAPMMDWTDRHFRFFMRLITRETLLYTEMIPTGAILRGDRNRFLKYSKEENPLSLQLGGDNPSDLAECSKIAEDYGYTEVNLNVGCPSDKVQLGNIGACLMAKPDHVAKALDAMKKAVSIPVTIKHRIGIDGLESYEDLKKFVTIVKESGTDRFIVHARIAILKGLSPAENRNRPPLRYEDVYRLKREMTDLKIEINGGIKTLDEAKEHLQFTDGVMIGRAAYENPYLFFKADQIIYGKNTNPVSRREIIFRMVEYLNRELPNEIRVHHVTRHMMGLFNSCVGARNFRRELSKASYLPGADAKILLSAISEIPDEILDTKEQHNISLTTGVN